MLRFGTFFLVCLTLAGCAPQGASISGAVESASPVANFAGDAPQTPAASRGGAPIAVVESERPASKALASARVPMPPVRPGFKEVQVAKAPEHNEPIARAEPIARNQRAGWSQATPPETTSAGTTAIAAAPVSEPETAPGLFPAFARSFAPAQETTTIAAATVAPHRAEPAPEPERLPIVRAAFTPGVSARFDPARRAYGYAPPSNAPDEGLEMSTPSRPGFNKTTPLVREPGQRYYAAYTNTEMSCFPQRLRDALNTIAKHYGKEVEVTSGMRHNGRRGSYHRRCMAADIRVPGVGPGALAAFAKTIEGVNGVGTYRHNSVTHIDIRDYQMSWRY